MGDSDATTVALGGRADRTLLRHDNIIKASGEFRFGEPGDARKHVTPNCID